VSDGAAIDLDQGELDALFNELAEESPEPQSAPEPKEPQAAPEENAAELDALFNELGGDDDNTPAAKAEPEPKPEPTPEPRPEPEPIDAAAEAVREELEADATPPRQAATPATAKPTVPAHLLPLIWLNWPVRHLTDPTRDTLGKVAVLTLINAAAILTYVLLLA
jgi:hypothetical protein